MEDTGAISLDNLGGLFIVIFAGIFLAVITLGFEVCYYKKKDPFWVESAVNKVSEIMNQELGCHYNPLRLRSWTRLNSQCAVRSRTIILYFHLCNYIFLSSSNIHFEPIPWVIVPRCHNIGNLLILRGIIWIQGKGISSKFAKDTTNLQPQEDLRKTSGRLQEDLRMTSGWLQDGFRTTSG